MGVIIKANSASELERKFRRYRVDHGFSLVHCIYTFLNDSTVKHWESRLTRITNPALVGYKAVFDRIGGVYQFRLVRW